MSDVPAPTSEPEASGERAPAEPPAGPDAEELRAIEALYEAGDFRGVSQRAPALAERAKDDPVRARARELAGRVQLDPFVLYAWGATVLVVAGIVYYYVIR